MRPLATISVATSVVSLWYIDGRRSERRAGAEEGGDRHRDGLGHGGRQVGVGDGTGRRQLLDDRGRRRGGTRHLQQHETVHPLPYLVQHRRGTTSAAAAVAQQWRGQGGQSPGPPSAGARVPGHKILKHDFPVTVGETFNSLQILGCELHKNAFAGPAPPGPAAVGTV